MFASMVTVPASENEWIARKGDESLFKVLKQMMPEVRQRSELEDTSCISFFFLKHDRFCISNRSILSNEILVSATLKQIAQIRNNTANT